MPDKKKEAPSERQESNKPRAAFGIYSDYWDDIICVRCMKRGRAHWEEGPTGKQLIGIDGDFYERLAKKAPYTIELLCNACGTVQPRRVGK